MNSRPPDYESGALPLSYCGKFKGCRIPTCLARAASDRSTDLTAGCCRIPTCLARPASDPSNYLIAGLCPGADSNRYALRHHPLKMACLPISPPGQHHNQTNSQRNTGPTGLEPATSRVTVECSNQAELRPQLLESGSETPSSPRTFLATEPIVSRPAE